MTRSFELTPAEEEQVKQFARWLFRLYGAELMGELSREEIDRLVKEYPGMKEYEAWHKKRVAAARKAAAPRRRRQGRGK